MNDVEQLAIEKIRSLPLEAQKQVLTFAEFLDFKIQQLEDEALLKAMAESKNEATLDLADAKSYLDSL